jgi:hypothetical protein
MVHTNPEFEISNLILDFDFDQHLGSHKHVINIIMWFRDMGCYNHPLFGHLLREVSAWWCLSHLQRILTGWSHGVKEGFRVLPD